MEVINTAFEELLPFIKLYVTDYVIGEILGTLFAVTITVVAIVLIIKSFIRR